MLFDDPLEILDKAVESIRVVGEILETQLDAGGETVFGNQKSDVMRRDAETRIHQSEDPGHSPDAGQILRQGGLESFTRLLEKVGA